jgi:hypothetical protein
VPTIQYVEKRFSADSREVIRQAIAVCKAYADQGYDLTLRQLYYQFVARDWLANTERSYKRLGSIVNDARLAGLLDWDYIVDRTRNLRTLPHWNAPADLVKAAAEQFRLDRWAEQPKRVEVWIEKDALVGVLESACPGLDVDYFSCRGYTSQSEIWGAAQRIGGYLRNGQDVTVLHLGDHDPSGIDMTRDIRDRLSLFIAQDVHGAPCGLDIADYRSEVEYAPDPASWGGDEPKAGELAVRRIALNMAQIEAFNPPPNPAKLTDSRAADYIARYGRSSWELDALDPATLVSLIEQEVAKERDDDAWDASSEREEQERSVLTAASTRWGEVREFLNGKEAGE